jgi:hypothetical protein
MIDVEEITYGHFSSAQGGADLLGHGFSVIQADDGEFGNERRGTTYRIYQQGSRRQLLRLRQYRLAQANLDLDRLALVGQNGRVAQDSVVLR